MTAYTPSDQYDDAWFTPGWTSQDTDGATPPQPDPLPDLPKITVVGSYIQEENGHPVNGSILLQADKPYVVKATGLRVVPHAKRVWLEAGKFEIDLPVGDDAALDEPVNMSVEECFPEGRKYMIRVKSGAEGPQPIHTLTVDVPYQRIATPRIHNYGYRPRSYSASAPTSTHTPMMYSGDGVPTDPHINGDVYLDNTNGDLYQQQNGVWVRTGNILGPAGPRGPAGAGAVSASTTPQLTMTSWPTVFEQQATGFGGSVVQTMGWDSTEQNWYTGQRDITDTDLGRMRVNRHSRDGTYLDSMVIDHGGHGTMALERAADGMYVWVGGNVTDDQARALTRIPYAAGTTVDAATQPWLTPRPGAYRVSAAVDPVHRTLAFRWQTNNVSSPTSTAFVDLYDLDVAAQGTFEPLGTIAHPPLTTAMQGFTSLGTTFYDYWGNAPDDPTVRAFDWGTGRLISSQQVGAFSSQRPREPEGICVYDQAGDRTRATLAFGFTGGSSGARTYSVARFPFPETPDWTPVDYNASQVTPNSPNYVPQYRIDGDRVWLHFSFTKTGGGAWVNGAEMFRLPPEARPNRTQRLEGTCGSWADSSSVVRFEVTTNGAVTLYDKRGLTVWVGADCTFWRT
ncbi:hypothetical protein [Streptomyces sp. NBC_00470]|uniref:phage baseplate protein n=1 Tax=Streptomyces sp. NBC_00470 TaxID=2975753 RepID=UPI0030E41248